MTISKLTLALSVATLLSAAGPVLADDQTDEQNARADQNAYATVPENGLVLFYGPQRTYRGIPSPIQNPDVLPAPTRPLGDVGDAPDLINDRAPSRR